MHRLSRNLQWKNRRCDPCKSKHIREKSLKWYHDNHAHVKNRQKERAQGRPAIESKRCNTCENIKLINEFASSLTSSDGYEHKCKECCNQRYRDEYYPSVREDKLASNKEWRDNNIEHRQEYKRVHHKKYYAENRDKFIERASQRRARELNAKGSHTQQQWRDLIRMYGGICLNCKEVPDGNLTKDHIVALINGGTNWIWNIQPLCFSCNRKKWNKTIDFREGFFSVIVDGVIKMVPTEK